MKWVSNYFETVGKKLAMFCESREEAFELFR